VPFKFDQITGSNDDHVFFKDEYVYGVRGRSNSGFGLWQMAFGSKATLNEANFTSARAAMMGVRRKNGKPIGVNPTHLIVPPGLDYEARTLLKAMKDNGSSNEWANAVEPVVSAFVG
jgi:phage major head subunit gpT-like protein